MSFIRSFIFPLSPPFFSLKHIPSLVSLISFSCSLDVVYLVIPEDTVLHFHRYLFIFSSRDFLVERIVALKIQSQLNVRCFVSAVHRSSTSVDEASTRADWTPPPSAFNSPSVSQLESCSKYTIRMNFFMRSASDRWPHVATSRADPGNVRQRHMSMCPPMPFVRVLL